MMNWDLLAETPAAGLPKAQLPTARPPKLFVAKQFEPLTLERLEGHQTIDTAKKNIKLPKAKTGDPRTMVPHRTVAAYQTLEQTAHQAVTRNTI